MKKLFWAVVTVVSVAALWVGYNRPDWLIDPPIVHAQIPSDKYDGDCQPNATIGRCADKPVVIPQPITETPVQPIEGFQGK